MGRLAWACAVVALWTGAAVAQAYKVETLVPGSAFHGVHGIRFSPAGELWAGSVAGQSLYAVDPATGKVRLVEGPPKGMADDIAFGPGGQVVWTAISEGVVYSRKGEGPVEAIASIPSINAIAFSRDGKRLFASQVFGGDDLWELDPTGRKPPRKIREKMNGFNSFWPGPDGWLYGPVWFRGQVAKVHPDTGEMVVISEGLKTPASVKFDSKDRLYVIDTATGELLRADLKTGARTRVAQLSTSLDNFAIDSRDRIFVSNMADNGIQEVDPATGAVRQVIKGALAFPADLAVRVENGREVLHVADVFAYRTVDAATGQVRDVARVHALGTHLEYPTGATAAGDEVILASSASGTVQVFKGGKDPAMIVRELAAPTDALRLPDGSLLVAEVAAGRLSIIDEGKRTLTEGLMAPVSLALGPPGQVWLVEAAGVLSRVDLATGAKTPVATGLRLPKAVAVGPDGGLYVLEMGARQVVRVDPATGAKTVLATNLPVGLVTQPIPLAGGIAVGPSGTIYVSSDVENSILKLTPP
ncbi:SMP-30/gluconolactonase/LRE family protein [Phenylobacterium sp. J367]|uniref:SMP-30/gluconolactonase/LRE family protein n=1 Tax=Phenylobacterium sp. J367 TaxID=2898435 RepID=UPI002150B438|nr:SMP-30/gluconolactonase/LRE family protein [Phenylobacterium sp. J367]MCR5880914.1 SMP-30/gluconolactonase/LRE family protein [Phenylobacterium sp. J367]